MSVGAGAPLHPTAEGATGADGGYWVREHWHDPFSAAAWGVRYVTCI